MQIGSSIPSAPRAAAPCLGEHTDHVLRELIGLSAAEVDAARGAGVLKLDRISKPPGLATAKGMWLPRKHCLNLEPDATFRLSPRHYDQIVVRPPKTLSGRLPAVFVVESAEDRPSRYPNLRKWLEQSGHGDRRCVGQGLMGA